MWNASCLFIKKKVVRDQEGDMQYPTGTPYISFYRRGRVYYAIDQDLSQVYEAQSAISDDFRYTAVPDNSLPDEVKIFVEGLRKRWLRIERAGKVP